MEETVVKYAVDAGLTAKDQLDDDQPVMELQLLDEGGNPIRFSSGAGPAGPQGPAGPKGRCWCARSTRSSRSSRRLLARQPQTVRPDNWHGNRDSLS